MRFRVYNSNVDKFIEADSALEAMNMFALTNPEHAADTVLIKQLADENAEEEKA